VIAHPGLDAWVPPGYAREPEEPAHYTGSG
jgi:hypothetical protein